ADGNQHESTLILATEPFTAKEKGTPAQPAIQPFRSDCQPISAHPSARKASWISAPLIGNQGRCGTRWRICWPSASSAWPVADVRRPSTRRPAIGAGVLLIEGGDEGAIEEIRKENSLWYRRGRQRKRLRRGKKQCGNFCSAVAMASAPAMKRRGGGS